MDFCSGRWKTNALVRGNDYRNTCSTRSIRLRYLSHTLTDALAQIPNAGPIPACFLYRMTSPPRTYPLSVQLWREEGAIEVEGSDGRRVCTIPVGSIYRSSDETWEYVLYCVQECVEEPGYLCKLNTTEAIDCRSKPHAGRFTYRLRGESTAYSHADFYEALNIRRTFRR